MLHSAVRLINGVSQVCWLASAVQREAGESLGDPPIHPYDVPATVVFPSFVSYLITCSRHDLIQNALLVQQGKQIIVLVLFHVGAEAGYVGLCIDCYVDRSPVLNRKRVCDVTRICIHQLGDAL